MSDKMPAQCHCGEVVFRVALTDELKTVMRCNCSFCRMRGAVMAPAVSVEVIKGKEKLTEYRFNSRTAAHYFCSVCGIYTFHQRRSDPRHFAVNVACLEGVSPFDFSPVRVNDGINHQNDGGKGGVAGWLSYQPE
ncbi:GFA family protein [Erwinia amylovora]